MSLEVGSIVEGKVTKIMPFGAFVSLPEKKSGLVHISEVARDYVENIADHLKEGDTVKVMIIGMENGKITTIESNIIQAAFKVTKHLFKRGSSSLVTLIYGNGASEEDAEELASLLTAKFGSDIEVSVINGGQPVYYFIISVE